MCVFGQTIVLPRLENATTSSNGTPSPAVSSSGNGIVCHGSGNFVITTHPSPSREFSYFAYITMVMLILLNRTTYER